MSDKPDLLMWDEVEAMEARSAMAAEMKVTGETARRIWATIRALARAMADSPCPVCKKNLYPDGIGGFSPGECGCPHCGDYPPDRRGLYATGPGHALEMVSKLRKGGLG